MRENETLTQNLQDESDFSEKLTKKYEKLNNQYIDLFKGYKKLEKENSSLHQENALDKKEPVLTPSFFNIYSFVRDNH